MCDESAVGAEELVQEESRLLGEDAGDHLGAVIQPAVADHVPETADRTGLLVVRPKTSRSMRARTAAPAHMVHGSSVTIRVHPSSRH
jgi:hypothetical protein